MTTRHLINVLLLAAAGYGAFAIISVVFKALSPYTVFIDWIAGLWLALAFAISESFNTGRGVQAGVVRRIGVSVVTMIVAGVFSTPLTDALGLRPLKGAPHYGPFAVWLMLFGAIITMIWFTWIPEKRFKSP